MILAVSKVRLCLMETTAMAIARTNCDLPDAAYNLKHNNKFYFVKFVTLFWSGQNQNFCFTGV